ncbi:MAG: hypothetical protein IT581_23485 [Verrucomicrobiales bacterium]|nr:hypothetical protein [Verrucomicrobiales bacterium]
MRKVRGRWLSLVRPMPWVVLIGLAVSSLGAGAADDSRTLKEELEKVRRENEILRQENARLKGAAPAAVPVAPAVSVSTPSAAPASPVTPAAGTAAVGGARTVVIPAPVEEGSRVTMEELLSDYQTSSMAGDAKYKGRRFRIEGQVDSFKKAGFIGMNWAIQLKAKDRLGAVRCKTSFPGISDFRPSPNGRLLEGRRPFKAWQVLLQQDQAIALEGVCEGIDDSVVVMKDCEPAR